jgi:hypothetical protein
LFTQTDRLSRIRSHLRRDRVGRRGKELAVSEGPDREREPEGDHAAERLEEFIRERYPGGLPPEERPRESEGGPGGGESQQEPVPEEPDEPDADVEPGEEAPG